MVEDSRRERVVAGTAGRALCLEIVTCPGYGEVRMPLTFERGAREGSPEELLDELEQVVANGNYRRFLDSADPSRLARALVSATYDRTRPERSDTDLARREASILAPVAEALLASPAAKDWDRPCVRDCQSLVSNVLFGEPDRVPELDPHAALDDGVAKEDASARRLRRSPGQYPPPPNVGHTDWIAWSCPLTPWHTTGPVSGLPELPALELIWDWDDDCIAHPEYWPVEVSEGARVYEIDGAAAWTALVDRFPRDVTFTRRSNWWFGSSWDGTWLLPDWSAVRETFDGVHLTVAGFLETTAGILPVRDGRTTLTYWTPDSTYWLNDVVRITPPGRAWNPDVLPDDEAGVIFEPDGRPTVNGSDWR